MLTQWHLSPLLTRTVKSSLFTHVHSSPLSLAARLHPCYVNSSCYISNGWTFSRQTSYFCVCVCFPGVNTCPFFLSKLRASCQGAARVERMVLAARASSVLRLVGCPRLYTFGPTLKVYFQVKCIPSGHGVIKTP